MAFGKIPQVLTAQELIDRAFRAGRKARVQKRRTDDALAARRKKERERLTSFTQQLAGDLKTIPRGFPSTDALNEFYRELFSLEFSLDTYRQRLGRLQNAPRVLTKLRTRTRGRLDAATAVRQIDQEMRQFFGRATNVVEDLEADLVWLEEVRQKIQKFPTVKEQFTVCIAGFPNVGKTTLLTEFTGSEAEINEYAFTTKSLNLGYRKFGYVPVQFIDTPGTLNREKMNPIELQAHLALKYLADVILYVWDLTEQYSLEQQEALRKTMEEYRHPVFDLLSKQDIVPAEKLDAFRETHATVEKGEFLSLMEERAKRKQRRR